MIDRFKGPAHDLGVKYQTGDVSVSASHRYEHYTMPRAGGGGFVLIFAAPEKQAKIREKLKKLLLVPFKFESLGSQIIFYHPDSGKV